MIDEGYSRNGNPEKKISAIFGILAVICFSFPLQAQFSGWSYYQSVTLSVTGVTAAETNYPLLVRLTSSNSSVWANCNSSGTDIRFSDPTGVTAYSFQRAYWNYSTTTAEFWVLVPTVNISGNATTFRMYYGNPGATDASSGSAVFQTSNKYQAVWHMTSVAGTSDTDATGSGHNLVSSATAPTTVTNAPVGVGIAKAFDGTSSYYTANNSGGASSSLIMPTGGPFTMSCWFNPLATLQAGKQVMGKICTNGITTWTGSYGMVFNGSTAGDLRFNDINGTASERCHYQLTASTWYHLVWTRISTGNALTNTNVYVNGTLAGATVTNGTTNARVDSLSWCIGRDCALSTSTAVEYCPGQIAEVQVSNVVRDPGWATISYQTQLSTSTAVSFGSQTANTIAWPNPPALAAPANNALNQPSTENFSWVAVTSAATYELQVSGPGDNTFATTMYDNATLTGTSQSVSGLSYATTYYWRVQGLNSGNSPTSTGWSTVNSFTTGIAPPAAAPSLSSPASPSSNLQPAGLSLYWGTVSGATSYGILVSSSSGFSNTVFSSTGTVTGDSVVPTNLAYNTTYYWEVNAANAGGTTAWSSVWSFSTIVAPPGAPTTPSPANGAINQSFSSLTLSWSQGTGGAPGTYNLNLGTSTNFSGTVAGGAWTTTYSPGTLASSTTYYWQVQAMNANTASAPWSAIWSFTTNENYGLWGGSQSITLNTSATGANIATGQHFFPVLLRLNTGNAAAFFTSEQSATSAGADLRFSNPNTGVHLPYEINKLNMTTKTALVWVSVDTIYAGNATQSINMYYGKSGAVSQSDSANVFMPSNGFGVVLHLNKRYSSGTYNVFSDATGNGHVGNGSNTLGDTTCAVGAGLSGCAFDSAACFHLTGPGNNILSGDSIQIASLLGNHNAITMSAWIRTDSLDQYNTGVDGHQGTLISMDDYDNLCVGGAYGTGTDSLIAAWSNGSAWANYGWPSTSLTGTNPQLNQSNTSGHAIGTHTGWKYVAFALNPSATTPIEKLYVNGDSVRNIGVANTLGWSGGNGGSGYRTVLGKQATTANVGERFGGSMVEMRIDTTIRSSDWIHLCYENQGAADYLTNPPPQPPTLSSPSNGAAPYLTSSLSLSWTATAGPSATSYQVQVSTVNTFASTVYQNLNVTSGTSVVPTGLAVSKLYYWEVSASNSGGASAWSSIWSFTPQQIPAPAAPTLATPTNGATGEPLSLNLTWGTVSTAATYGVQVSTTSTFSNTVSSQSGLAGTTAAISGLGYFTTYYWEASATNAGGTTWSGVQSFTTMPSTPTMPTLALPASGTQSEPTALTLSWTSATFDSVFAVQVSTSASFSTTAISLTGLTGTFKAISGLLISSNYYWRAEAINSNGVSGWTGAWSFATASHFPAPMNTGNNMTVLVRSAIGPTVNGVAIQNGDEIAVFNHSGYCAGTTTWEDTAAADTNDYITVWGQNTVNGQPEPGMAAGEILLYRVWDQANSNELGATATYASPSVNHDANDTNVFLTGGNSILTSLAAATKPAVPALASPTTGTTGVALAPTLSWNSVSTASSYAVQLSTASGFGSTVTAQWGLTGTSASFTGLANLTNYFWRVGAKNVGGMSGWSGVWNFTTIIAAPNASPMLVSPGNDTLNAPTSLVLTWTTVTNAATYAVQVSLASGFGSTVTAQWGLTGTSATISGLANSTTYFWRAGAKDAGGISGWSAPYSFTTIIAAPAVPALATPTSGSVNQPISLSLNWGTVANAATYAIQVSTDVNFGSTVTAQWGLTGTSASVTGLANATTYFWRAGAKDLGGTSGWSAPYSFMTIVATPAVPTLATPSSGTVNESISPTLTWGTVTNAATYAVQVSTDVNFGSTVTAQIGLTVGSASITGLANSTTYFWRAGAKDLGGVSGWSGAWSFSTIIAAPAIPALATPSSGAVNQPISLSLNWGAVTGAASYSVLVSTAANFATTVSSQVGLTGVSASLAGLANLTTYYWEVNAANIGGTSLWSAAWNFTTIVAAPAMPSLASPASGAINEPVSLSLNWGTVTGATSYTLMVSTAANFATTVSGQTGLTGGTATVGGLASGGTYYWEVNAANIGGTSAWSGVWSFTTLVNFSLVAQPGWNMISFNIRPADSSASAIFGDSATVAGKHNFILVKNLAGDVYCPTLGIRESIVVQTGVGLQMYSDSLDTVRTAGSAIPAFSTPIPLLQGWNLTGYLPPTTEPVATALSTISSQLLVVKDNNGDIYWPEFGIDIIDTLAVEQGYFIYMTTSAPLTYSGVAKRTANAGSLLRLPKTTHYAKHANTGNNASVLASLVSFGRKVAPDSCEIGAFDGNGNLVGSGTVIHGLAAFPVWGKNIRTKSKDGLGASEKITFKMWNKTKEYAVEFKSADGSAARYSAQAVFLGSFAVPEGALINEFNLSRAYPNPFRGSVNIAFDVPTIAGISQHGIEIDIFDMKGSLVKQLARGTYQAGHYDLAWNCCEGKDRAVGSGIYIVRMKAANFEKRLKLIRIQ